MKTILVTGGAGFIGSCFVKMILNKYSEYRVINLDALTYCGNTKNLEEIADKTNYSFIQGSILDKKLVTSLVKESDFIVNFAAETHVDNSIKSPEVFFETNVMGTITLLSAAREVGVERFIQISTDEVYGSLQGDGFFEETTPLAPNSPYSASKAGADMACNAYWKTYDLPVIITRCSNNYGEYQYPEKIIPLFITKLLKDEKVPIYGDGLQIRDWLYVQDHCEAIDLVLHKGRIGEVYNIGGHNEKTNLEITRFILDALGKDENYIDFVQDRRGHDRHYAMSNEKIMKELGWVPKVKFAEGLKKTIEWYLSNRCWSNRC